MFAERMKWVLSVWAVAALRASPAHAGDTQCFDVPVPGRREHEYFLNLLGEVHERYRFRIHAYCLLVNYWHSIIQTPDANLSQGVQWLGLVYSSWRISSSFSRVVLMSCAWSGLEMWWG